ncbi:uncharacterized protein LOC111640789 [Centruroides sculpturatus]|uniref:uncharacterized protein LOC111640788 n=1 Tax=Centruroides sculpturatus TaxID=218467 RepID=UPI000C6D9803|nr:uncharacterized protein LOC111640788 [Centruroides sculpturatus]XP_023242617.1 uncharacterized protein LOC111640789 [Centruroides sculpturatus]
MQRSPTKRGRPPRQKAKSISRKETASTTNIMLITDCNEHVERTSPEPLSANAGLNPETSLLSSQISGEPFDFLSSPGKLENSSDMSGLTLWNKISELINVSNTRILNQMTIIKEDLDQIRNSIQETKDQNQKINSQIINLEQQIVNLKIENESMHYRMDNMVNVQHRNNIMFYRYPSKTSPTKLEVFNLIKESFELHEVTMDDLIAIIPITKSQYPTIKLIIKNSQIRDYIYSSFIKMKQQNLSNLWKETQISQDLTKRSRLRRKQLIPFLSELKKAGKYPKLRGDSILLGNYSLTYSYVLEELVYSDSFTPFSTSENTLQ